MDRKRVIARLDVKNDQLIKTIQLEGLRIVGCPKERMRLYYEEGIDEVIYMDIVASLYGRNSLHKLTEWTAKDCFVPLTVGGGIRSVEDARRSMRSGADKLAINSGAIKQPDLIDELAREFGSQAVVLSVEAKRQEKGTWSALFNNGRENIGLDVSQWISEACDRGAGEILLTSVDREGTRKGFDLDLAEKVVQSARVPLIVCGGFKGISDAVETLSIPGVDGIALSDALHFNRFSVEGLKEGLADSGISVRLDGNV